MIMRKKRISILSSIFNIKNYNNWLKRTSIRIIIVSILLISVLTIKILNFEKPQNALGFIKSQLEFDADATFYFAKTKRLLAYVPVLSKKAVTAIKIEDKLHKSFVLPTHSEITTYFDENIGQTSNISKGLIFAGHEGQDIYSVDDGVIIDVGSNKSVGNYIIIKHKGELLSVYKYVGTNHVDINQVVEQGQVIGSSSKKLLLEIWYRNEPVDPIQYLDTSPQQL